MRVFLNHKKVQLKEGNSLIYSINRYKIGLKGHVGRSQISYKKQGRNALIF